MEQELLNVYLNGNISRVSGEGSLDNYEIKDYYLERNISFSLPFNFSKHSSKERYEKKLEISTIDNNKVVTRQLEITSELGPLNGVDQDVLLCLMSLAKAQDTDMPNFTIAGICKILQISDSSTKKIKDSIRKMIDVKLVFKDSFVGSEGKVHKEYITRLINNVEFQDVIKRNSTTNEYHFVRFDRKVIDNLMKDFTISIPREFYNKLPYGGPKRLLQLLEANWVNTKKPIYIAKVTDLASILGINSEIRFIKRKIKEYLEALKESGVNLEYSFHGASPLLLRVSYSGLDSETSLEKECSEIYEKYLTKFNYDYLEKYGIRKYLSFWSMKYHSEKDYVFVGKQKIAVKKIYLAIEQLLDQYKNGQIVKNFHALIDKTYHSIIINEMNTCLIIKENKSENIKAPIEKVVDLKTIENFQLNDLDKYNEIKLLAQQEFAELFEDFDGFTFETYFNSKLLAELKKY